MSENYDDRKNYVMRMSDLVCIGLSDQSDMSDPVTVTVKQGALRGVETDSVTGGSYLAFRGIPYAAPPVGELRFRDPQPPEPWSGVRDASKEGPKCAQSDLFTKKVIGDDDCLYLNVATTTLAGSRPVMVWIHGGAFVTGDGGCDSYSPDYLMGSGIVYVGINYRLGVFGFLNLNHEVATGNMGLKDQVAALKWVKENIAQFGGDPNNVTIFGESAGGASVHYLLLSPLAKGLFHKAISQSGVALNPWALVTETVDIAHRFVAALGRDMTNPREIVEYLRTVPAHKLIEIQETVLPLNLKTPELSIGPSVDDKSIEPFLPKLPEELIKESSDIPVIFGYNSHEGLLFLIDSFLKQELKDEVEDNIVGYFETMIPRELAAKAPSKVPEIGKEIRKLYFGDKRITKDLVDEYVQYWGDVFFGVGIHRLVEILRKQNKSPTYLYRFSYDSENSVFKKFFQLKVKGTIHSAELSSLFFASQFREHINLEPGTTDEKVRHRFVRMWTDFAKTGNPTPTTDDLITTKWDPVTRTTKNYLEIDAKLSSGVNPNEDMWDTWKRVYAMVDNQ